MNEQDHHTVLFKSEGNFPSKLVGWLVVVWSCLKAVSNLPKSSTTFHVGLALLCCFFSFNGCRLAIEASKVSL